MFIVDAQVHIWGADTPERPWPSPRQIQPHREQPFSKEDLLHEMNAAGVRRVVVVPPAWEGDRNDLALEAARSYSERFAVMGRLNPESPASRGLMASWRQQRGMLGLRLDFKRPLVRPTLSEGRADWLWKEAEQAGVPIMVLVDSAQLEFMDQIADRHPGLRLAIDHMARTTGAKDEEAFGDLDKLLAVAKRPNVAVKATCLPRYTRDSYPYRRLHPYLRRIYDAFGPKRVFWGTDLTHLSCSYTQAITMITEEIPWLSVEDKKWIMGRGICEWLGWPMPAES